MKKTLMALTIIALVAIAGYNMYRVCEKEIFSGIVLENVEALAQSESGSGSSPCDSCAPKSGSTCSTVIVTPGGGNNRTETCYNKIVKVN